MSDDVNHVFEGDPVSCEIKLQGSKYEKAEKAEFVFYNKEDDKEVGREEATLAGGVGTCEWTAPTIEDEAVLKQEVYYAVEFEIDGEQKKAEGFGKDITVWTRQVKITAKDPDGKALKDAKLEVLQGDTCEEGDSSTVRRTDSTGTFTYDLRKAADVLVQFLAPYNVLEWTKGKEDTGRVRECKVEKKPYKAEIWSHPGSASEVRHYVNLAESADEPHHGHILKLRIGAKGDKGKTEGQLAEVGDEIHYQIKISEWKRDDPAVSVKVNNVAKTATGTREWKDKIDLKAAAVGGYAALAIDITLGYEGGLEVEIKVGATPDCADQTLKLKTWRRLYYELMAPDTMVADLNGAASLADDSEGTDYADALRGKMTERLAPIFLEYLCWKSHIFPEASATAGTIVPAAYFGDTGRAKHVLCSATATTTPLTYDGTKANREIKVRLCDKAYSTQGVSTKVNSPVLNATAGDHRASSPNRYVFEYSMKTGTQGSITVAACKWSAKIDNIAPYRQDDGTYSHPGLNADGTKKEGNVALAWFTYKDHQTVQITLPSDAAPGNLVGAISAAKCPINMEFKIEETYAINGNAGGGGQIMVLKPDYAPANSSTVCHELGHGMGMCIMTGRSKNPPGLDFPDHVDDDGLYYRKGTPVGENGLRASHVGAHCATGVSDTDADTMSGGSCIMFGAGGTSDSRPNFCDQCKDYLKARRLTDIVTSWSARADDEY